MASLAPMTTAALPTRVTRGVRAAAAARPVAAAAMGRRMAVQAVRVPTTMAIKASRKDTEARSKAELEFPELKDAPLAAAAALAPLLLPGMAMATGGEFGLLEGRTVALIHPAVMAVLFCGTAWAGWLGWNWRRVRTVGAEITELKASVPTMVTTGGEEEKGAIPSDVQAKLDVLTAERKDLVAGDFKNRHTNWGNILLALGVLISVEGGVNTWMRTGKLFPGPHLFAGAGITVLWALAAALVPYMQKGNETARNLHIALNCVNLALFAWQVPTGLDIVYKVFEFTSWP